MTINTTTNVSFIYNIIRSSSSKNMAKTPVLISKLVAYTLLISILSLFMCNVDGNSNNITGFSIDIFHRDSPLSPTYNSSLHPDQHLVNAVQRSNERARLINIHILNKSPFAYLYLVKGTYLTSFELGTPPVRILTVVDTGSSLIWTQCKGCNKCFPQQSPYFDPQHSSTFKNVLCASPTCRSSPDTYCNLNHGKFCNYKVGYADHSYSLGQLSTDTITFRSTYGRLEPFPSIAFGCGYNNGGVFTGQESGVLGLGNGYGSLIRQLDSVVKGRFSYCLVPIRGSKRSSRLNFGDSAIVSGPGTVSTRLFFLNNEFYSVILDAVSINHVRLEYPKTQNNLKVETNGNMIIDSGSLATYLNKIFYQTVVNALKNHLRLRTVADPGRQFDTCFNAKHGTIRLDITFHFKGANVDVGEGNIFVRRNAKVICFAVVPTGGISILGSISQANFLVGFDLNIGRLAFRLQLRRVKVKAFITILQY